MEHEQSFTLVAPYLRLVDVRGQRSQSVTRSPQGCTCRRRGICRSPGPVAGEQGAQSAPPRWHTCRACTARMQHYPRCYWCRQAGLPVRQAKCPGERGACEAPSRWPACRERTARLGAAAGGTRAGWQGCGCVLPSSLKSPGGGEAHCASPSGPGEAVLPARHGRSRRAARTEAAAWAAHARRERGGGSWAEPAGGAAVCAERARLLGRQCRTEHAGRAG